MGQTLKLAGLILVLFSVISCDSAKEKAIRKGIIDKETNKGNEIISYDIGKQTDHSGMITVLYTAQCQKTEDADVSKSFNVADSVQVWKTGDGNYQAR